MKRKIMVILISVLMIASVVMLAGCVENSTTDPSMYVRNSEPYFEPTQTKEAIPSLDYQSDTSAIRSELSLKGYTVYNVDFTKNNNGLYVLLAMIDTKGNYDKEVLDTYRIMHENGVADYYVVGIVDYEIQSSSSFTVTKNTLDDFFSGRITEDEYMKQVTSEKLIEKLGELVLSGEEGGTCVVSEINMWSEPKSALDGAYVMGKIPNACPKTEVPYYEERDLKTLNGRIWYKVESGNIFGWITDSFVIQKK